jgi:HEAT repeat protein
LDALFADLISGDETLAEAAMNKLVALGEEAFPKLKELLISPEADHRWWALSVLAQIETADADWMIPALKDESVEVRQCAALGLSVHPDPKVVSALIGALHDPDSMVSTLATNALAKIGETAVPALLTVCEEKEVGKDIVQIKAARLGAMRALATIGDKRAIPAMMAALEEDSVFMNHWAETGLEKLGLDMVYMKLK